MEIDELVPIGLRSAEEQSYLVMYPLNDSSTFALASTSRKPDRPISAEKIL